ncbi:MAG: TlpA disulfide reductase family protein [Planctomycetota bacterium]
MPEKSRKHRWWAIVPAVIAALIVILWASDKKEKSHLEIDAVYHKDDSDAAAQQPDKQNSLVGSGEQQEPTPKTLREIVANRRTWDPAFASWYGRGAPDFSVTDINGTTHRLSQYRGKNVMLIFWATWCAPCRMEVPHLVALRNIAGREDLAMLAISFISPMYGETPEKVKDFVSRSQMPINYTVISTEDSLLPSPFNSVNGLPSAFFIDKGGNIKLATVGTLTLGEMKAIIQAGE